MSIIIIQPALPTYRYSLFDRLASHFGRNFTVYASRQKSLGILDSEGNSAPWLRRLGPMRTLLPGLEWQPGAVSVPIAKGDTLVVSGAPRTLSTLVLMIKAKVKGARVLWWGHYWSSTSKAWRARLRLALMRLSDGIIFYTEQEISEYAASRTNSTRRLLVALNNGIDTSGIVRLRAPYLTAHRPRDLLFIGRVTPRSELEVLLNALSRTECADITLDVIGDGPSHSDLSKLAEALGVGSRVRWHGALIDEQRIAEVANSCKIFIYPGSVGLSLIHGFAYGLPAVIHDNRWLHGPEFAALEADGNGVVFRKGDSVDLAGVLSALISNPVRMDAMSSLALATTEHTFNVNDMVQRMISALT